MKSNNIAIKSISGGYKTQTVAQVGNLLSSYNRKEISLRALRIYMAALAIVATREAAKRSRPVWKNKKAITPRFLFTELAELTELSESNVKRELKKLEKAGLLLFSETEIQFTDRPLPQAIENIGFLSGSRSAKRPVPIPRPMLRYLAKEGREATIKTALAYMVRGLSISRQGEITGKGTAKASWIAEAMGLSVRAVRTARAELIELEFLSDDEGSKQWKLNRDGAYFQLNLDWKEPHIKEKREAVNKPKTTDFARPTPQKRPNFAPPYKDKKTSFRTKHQKTQTSSLETSGREKALRAKSGFCKKIIKNKSSDRTNQTKHSKKIRIPILRDINPDDLRRLSTLKILYAQAVKAKWLTQSEANFQNFVATAVRATRTEGDSVRIFVSIVKKGLWQNITQAQEDRAREIIQKVRNRKLETAMQNSPLLSKLEIFSTGNISN
jgi:DNA-binding transcriptional ArsR family regulator